MTPDPLPANIGEPLSHRAEDAARVLGLSVRTLQALTAADEIPHCRVGRAVLYPRAELAVWLSAKTAAREGGEA